MKNLNDFKRYLLTEELSENTIKSYMYSMKLFFQKYNTVNKQNIMSFKSDLMENHHPKSVNLRLQAINKYLSWNNKTSERVKTLKIQHKPYLDNVISNKDYNKLKEILLEHNELTLYYAVWFMCATGARISELLQITAEDVKAGYIDLYAKGKKHRRIYFPNKLCKNAVAWLDKENTQEGFVFLNSKGKKLTARLVSYKLKIYAQMCKIETKTVYPHSFRHRFAKNFLSKNRDIALLADLMGHENIETTRIYLRNTSYEQRKLIDKIVDW